jgi:hypothetical protein
MPFRCKQAFPREEKCLLIAFWDLPQYVLQSFNRKLRSGESWLTWIMIQEYPGSLNLSLAFSLSKITKGKKAEDVAQEVELMPQKIKVLSLNPSTTKKEERKKEKRNRVSMKHGQYK